jgi:hypothetical protein
MGPNDFQPPFRPTPEDYALLYGSLQEQATTWSQTIVRPPVAHSYSGPAKFRKNPPGPDSANQVTLGIQKQSMVSDMSLSVTPVSFQGYPYSLTPPKTLSPDGHAHPAAASTHPTSYIQYRPLMPAEPPPDTGETVSARKEASDLPN